MSRIALKVRPGNQQVLRIFMTESVSDAHEFLRCANAGLPSRRSSMEVLEWGANQNPVWELLGTTSGNDGQDYAILYLGNGSLARAN